MSSGKVIVIFNGEIQSSSDSLAGYTIENGYTVQAFENGLVSTSKVNEGGILRISGGTARDTKVYSAGILDCQEGRLENTSLYSGAQLDLQGISVETTVIGAEMTLHDGGAAKSVTVMGAGQVLVNDGGYLESCALYSGNLDVNGGSAYDIEIIMGTMTISDSAFVSTVTLSDADASLLVEKGAIIYGLSSEGASTSVSADSAVINSELWSYTSEEGAGTVHASILTLHSGACHYGTLFIDSRSTLIAEAGSVIDFTMAGMEPEASALINDFSRISGAASFTMTVSAEQAVGTYALAGNAAGFTAPISLQCGEFTGRALNVGETVTYHNGNYALILNNGKLSADVKSFETAASAEALSWGDINGAENYVLEMGGAQFDIASQKVDLFGLANGDYAWRVRNVAEADNWQTGEAFSQTAAPEGPQKLEAVPNDATDLFFAKEDGIWGSGFMAQHVGNKGGWSGTGETVGLAGKARITDIFAGSEDASILVCSVPMAQASGVALFLDDIYSTCPVPEAKASARLSQINTILATEGADIIDLTSRRFAFDGGVTVHGNGGDDVIWANSGENTLFGGDGDDRIIGGSGNDILIGGAGDDILHGGGGSDIFCFGENWGNDTVSQLAGENDAVTLWFSQSNDILQLSFTADGNDTLITASTSDTIRAMGMSVTIDDCRFGAAGYETEYNTLAATGVFA